MNATHDQITVAEALLELLASRGVKYFFGNSGTDFAPIIEAFAKRQAQGKDRPVPLTVPHEIPAVAMAAQEVRSFLKQLDLQLSQ